MGTDLSVGLWLFDASKYVASFFSGAVMLWAKDAIERSLRRKHTRRALWHAVRHELMAAGETASVLNVVQSVAAGNVLDGRLGFVDFTKALEADAVVLDPSNIPVFWKLRGHSNLAD